jgi:two-component system response regulator
VTEGPVLLIEDNPDDTLLTVRAFEKCGFANEVLAFSDGEAALAALLPDSGASDLVPAMVLLDVKLPRVGGLEVLRRLRADARTRELPVIMLSTSREQRDIVESYRLGANSFVRKPLSFSQFVSAVHILGTYWLQINEPCPPPARR